MSMQSHPPVRTPPASRPRPSWAPPPSQPSPAPSVHPRVTPSETDSQEVRRLVAAVRRTWLDADQRPWKLWRYSQYEVGLPGLSQYPAETQGRFLAAQARLLANDAFVCSIVGLACSTTKPWAIKSLARYVALQAGNAAMIQVARGEDSARTSST